MINFKKLFKPKEDTTPVAVEQTNLTEKSVQDYIQSSVGYLNPQSYIRPSFNDMTALKQNKGFVAAAASKNAKAMAAVPLRMYVRKKDGRKCLWTTKPLSRKRMDYLTGELDRRPSNYVLKRFNASPATEYEEIILDHPLIQLLSSVNPYYNSFDMQYLKFYYLETLGNSYIYLEKDEMGYPFQMWVLPTQYVEIQAGEGEELISGYKYGVANTKTYFDTTEVVHYKYPSLTNMFYGTGKIEMGWSCIQINDNDHLTREALLKNSAIPSYAIIFKDMDSTQAGMNRYTQFLENKLQGPNKAGKFLAMPANIELKQLNINPKDLGSNKSIIEEIASVFSIPYSILTGTGITEQDNIYWYKNCISPTLIMDEQKQCEVFLKMWNIEDDCVLAYDDPTPENQQTEKDKVAMYLQTGVLTINDVRLREGLPAIPEYGDLPGPVLNSYIQAKYSIGSTGLTSIPNTTEEPESEPEEQSDEPVVEETEDEKSLGCKCCGHDKKKEPVKITKEQAEKIKEAVDKKVDNKKSLTTDLSTSVSANNAQVEKTNLGKFCEKYVDIDAYPEDSFMTTMVQRMNSIFEQQKIDCISYVNTLSGEKSLTSDLETILDGYTKQIVEQMKDPVTQIFGIAGQEALQQIQFTGIFDVTNPEVIKFIDKYLMKLSGVLNDTTLISVKNIIKEGLTDGSTIQEISDRIASSAEFSPVRSTMIARSETANSYINGEIVAWKQSGVVEKKRWIASPGACDICKQLNGKQVGLEDKFGDGWFNALPHPQCRCDNLAILS